MTKDDEQTSYEYINISWAGTSTSGKTNIYSVQGNRNGLILGYIKWWGRCRQYCFFPEPTTLYNKGCMRDIADFMGSLSWTKSHD